jgi:hypothetical protein
MEQIKIEVKATLQLDEKWANTQTTEELVEYLKARLNSSLGFRGRIKRLKLVSK